MYRHTPTNGALALLLALLAMGCCSCRREAVCDVPFGEARCQIDPNSPLYPGLNTVGGYEYLVGGHQGIIVVRTGYDSFVAFERSCPNDHEVPVSVDKDFGAAVLRCPSCGSAFSTYTDGVPLEGSSTPCSLYEYGADYIDGVLYLR